MSDKTEEFLQKLAPCIERGDLDACVEEAARVAREMGVGAGGEWSYLAMDYLFIELSSVSGDDYSMKQLS